MILLRHPRPRIRPGTCYGRLDVPAGPGAAAEIAACLKIAPPIRAVVASPATRCRTLATRLAARDGVPLRFDPRLLELDFGRWEGQAWDRIPRAESDPWAASPWETAPPGGESFSRLHARVAAALAEAPEGAALVTHAGVIRAVWMIRGGARFDTVFARSVPYATALADRLSPRETPCI